ncbi:hypothetical protein [Thalassobellus sediminis]|uniref:hypothetical protein n=1 Tax=Thalassobellus sediminis TaxID=3367753 RepID=UPI0037A88E57
MKKLSLKKLNIEAKDILQKSQIKSVFGGYEGGSGNILVLCIKSNGQVIGPLCLGDCYPTLYHCRQAYGSNVANMSCQGAC